ncbi:hypothetical protein [Methanosarcina mazei]|nr:hypothetical protein [Methanosarcina mazei]
MKKLIEKGLVRQENKIYRLSTVGMIVTEKLVPLLGTIEVFENNLEYWAQKDLTGIPAFLRLKLEMLSQYEVIEPQLNRMFLKNMMNCCSLRGRISMYMTAYLLWFRLP